MCVLIVNVPFVGLESLLNNLFYAFYHRHRRISLKLISYENAISKSRQGKK